MQHSFWEGSEMELPDIRSLVPHTGAMVLLDRVISVDQENLCAEVRIHADSLFAGTDGVGAWVGIEYMAQAIAAHAGYAARLRGEPVKIGFLLGSWRYECRGSIFPLHSVLRIHVFRVLQADNGLASFECRIEDTEKKILATATITVFEPADARNFLKESVE